MKITIKAKPEPVQQFKLRIPESLKALIDVNGKPADTRGADYNATAIEAFTRFNHDFHAQLTSSISTAGTNSETISGTENGTNPEPNLGPLPTAVSSSIDNTVEHQREPLQSSRVVSKQGGIAEER